MLLVVIIEAEGLQGERLVELCITLLCLNWRGLAEGGVVVGAPQQSEETGEANGGGG